MGARRPEAKPQPIGEREDTRRHLLTLRAQAVEDVGRALAAGLAGAGAGAGPELVERLACLALEAAARYLIGAADREGILAAVAAARELRDLAQAPARRVEARAGRQVALARAALAKIADWRFRNGSPAARIELARRLAGETLAQLDAEPAVERKCR